MRLSEMLIALFVVALFTTGFIGFYAAVLGANNNTTEDFYGSFNNTSSTQQTLENMYEKMNSSQNNPGSGTNVISFAPWNLIVGAYDTVMMSFQVPQLFVSMINDLGSKAGIPTYVSSFFAAIIMVTFIAAIIYLIIGRVF